LIGVTVLFTLILYPSFLVTQPRYEAGDIAMKDIKAPKDFLVEDLAATEIRRQQSVQEILTIYDADPLLGPALAQVVDEAFANARAMLRAAAEARSPEAAAGANPAPPFPDGKKTAAPFSAEDIHRAFEEKLGLRIGRASWGLLQTEGFSKRTADLIGEILLRVLEKGVISNREALLKDFEKGIILRDVRTKEEKTVKDLRQFSGIEQAKSLAQSLSPPIVRDLDPAQANLVLDLVQRLLQANITLNRNETEERRQRAASEIKPVLYKIKSGEMLLREGERVSELHLLKLKALELEVKRQPDLRGILGAAFLMLGLIVVTHILFLGRPLERSRSPGRDAVLMAVVFIFFLALAQMLTSFAGIVIQNSQLAIPPAAAVFLAPLTAAPMIICVFLRLNAALPFAVVSAVGAAVIAENSLPLCMYYLISGSMGAYWIRNCRERKVFIAAGAKTGLLAALTAAAMTFYLADFTWDRLFWGAAFAFLGGLGAGLVAAAIVPLVEIVFGYTTDITLLELANLDRPILRRLMMEAPGTYHHSVIVGSMVEAAASEIGANPLLAKVAGYFHDIGKIRKPLYFIENQRNGKNKHDKLAPSMSSLILISHIKEGVEIARENKLGGVIIDILRQHHGTSLIRYFYEKAKQLRGEEAVREADFRYPGPNPRTPEAALVMLADVVEAASRTLENPTPARIKGLVQNLIGRILGDGQLDECDITLRDIHKIAGSFIAILNGIHHHRIDYLEPRPATETGKGKGRNGHPDHQPPKAAPDLPQGDREDGPGRPRRLKAS
jgi:putative nucleotidyltransferase with HDIG domain